MLEFVVAAVTTVLERLTNEEFVIVMEFERLVREEVCEVTVLERLVREADVVDTVPVIVLRALDSPETTLDSPWKLLKVAYVLDRPAKEEFVVITAFDRLVSDKTVLERLVSEADVVDTILERLAKEVV